ncbi:MAG: hypothetical protein WCO11_11710 [Sphingomonadales bacterium]|jgi:hypothetical protein
MKNALIAILLCGVAVVACNQHQTKLADDAGTRISITTDGDGAGAGAGDGDAEVKFKADMESGKVALALPGGLGGTLTIPKGLEADTRFDLDGIGRYPGAKLVSVDIAGTRKGGEGSGRVRLGFTAPGMAGQVADWYEKALTAKGRPTSRSGNTLTSATEDGDPMVITLSDGPGGIARGQISLTGKSAN